MKNLLFTVFLALLVFPTHAQVQGAVSCSDIRDNNGAIVVSDMTDNGVVRACVVTPDSVQVDIYSISLCTENPSIANYEEVCDAIFSDPSGRTIEVSVSAGPASLLEDASFSEGTYSHAVLLFAGEYAVKHSDRFDSPLKGFGGVSGEYCSTRSGRATESDGESYVSCSNTSLSAEYFVEIAGRYIGSPACGGYDPNPSGQVNICMLETPTTESAEGDAANYIFVVQEFSTPVQITPSSQEIRAEMRLTDMMGIEDTEHSDPSEGYVSFFLNGVEFSATVR